MDKTVPARTSPLQPRDWVALGLKSGRCPVGMIEAIDDTWVSVRHLSFSHGHLMDSIEVIRLDDVERIAVAYPENATDDGEMRDEHLGELQTGWIGLHLPEGDPVWKAYREWQ